jgi:ribosome biogenesis GTPase / thiamine phosphate phosphatase
MVERRDDAAAFCAGTGEAALVMTVDRSRYVVSTQGVERLAELSGKFIFDAASRLDWPSTGDWVCVTFQEDGLGTIQSVMPRRSWLRRKTAGRGVEYQQIAANIDTAFIVQSCQKDFNVARLERFLVVVAEGHVLPHILLTKTDLVSAEDLAGRIAEIRAAGITAEVTALSNKTRDGVEAVRALMQPGMTYVLLGSSGVGKTTLINTLIGNSNLATGDVSGSGEGRHTTTRRQIITLPNGALLLDMPGMRELGLIGATEGIEDSFADIIELEQSCRFSNCTHVKEPGCAVRKAIADTALTEERLEHFFKLKRESGSNDQSYAERRKKDRNFGKMVKHKKK